MAKQVKNSAVTNKKEAQTKSFIPVKYQDALLVLLIGLLLIVFFKDAIFSGSFWGASDTINTQSFRTYLEQPGDYPLWQPYIFGGMPGFAAMMEAAVRQWDITVFIIYNISIFLKSLFNSDTARILLWYIVLAAGMYFMMRQYKQTRLISLFVAVSFIFCTGITIWVMIGHHAKPATFAMVPYIFIMMEKIKERVSLLNIVLLTIVMHIMLAGGHIQLIFYTAWAVIFYLLIDLVTRIVKKTNWLAIVKLTGVFVIATGIAVLMSADRYLSVLEYNPYSTRGSAPITARIEANKDGSASHVEKKTDKDYEYSTMWSFSPDEIIDLFVPSYHGFGKVDYSGQLTGNRETKIMTYWGQKPFEDATPYMGTVVMFLALLGMIRYFKSNTLVQAMTVTMFFGLLLSFGYTFPILYDLFFYNFPKFSSFRAPCMSLILMHFTVPILAAFGIQALCDMREKFGSYKALPKTEKVPLNVFFAAIGLFIVSGIIFAAVFENSYILEVTNSKALQGYGEQALAVLAPFIYDNTISDWTVIGLFTALLAIASYMFVNKKMSPNLFIIGVIAIVLIDLWRVSSRPIEIVDKQTEKEPFPRTDVINFILQERQQTGEKFRVCDMSSQVVNSDAYFLIENINGYFPAKLRTFQDMMDIMCQGSTSTVTHPFMWNLMNAKYIITTQSLGESIAPLFQSQQTGAYVYYNPSYCKRVFFVDSVKIADDVTILNNLNESNFNPKTLAYIEKDLGTQIKPAGEYDAEMKKITEMMQKNDSTTNDTNNIKNNTNENDFVPTAKIVEYKNEYIKIKTETKEQHLMVLSEMYYSPGWKAYIDDKETEIFKTNFAFRSVVVPAGNHTVEFKFTSDRFELGRTFSATSNVVVILLLIVGIVLENKRKKNNKNIENQNEI